MFGLDTTLTVFLILCLLLACFFEFINGFHDTANAVATVIYTNSLKPTIAVVYSGVLNFAGVMLGGITVAMGILNLLPMEVLIDTNPYHSVAMILALMLSSIFWNFGTWYYGIPSSSSHTIIGSIIGIGLAFYFLPGNWGLNAVNWDKAKETGLALLISPLLGFSLAIVVMFIFKRLIKNEIIYKEPIVGKVPPLWIRILLWCTCGMVSFFHGQNDGQKGVGILMMILIAILPGQFALNKEANLQESKIAIEQLDKLISRTDTTKFGLAELTYFHDIQNYATHFRNTTNPLTHVDTLNAALRFQLRKDVIKITKSAEKLNKSENVSLSLHDKKELSAHIKTAKNLIEYVPSWVVLTISLCLGLGTMFGWKRVVKTIGEKIGKQHMSYAQGASAEIVASIGISLASFRGSPVSTTHMLSSGIAGSMVAKKGLKNLQKGTIKTIVLTWLLTLPVTIVLSGSLFLMFRALL